LDKEKNWLKLSITSEYEQTRFDETDFNLSSYDNRESVRTLRGTLSINGKYHPFKEKLVLNYEFYTQPLLDQDDNYRWLTDTGLELPIWDFLNFKTNYRYGFESIVIQGQDEEGRILIFRFSNKSYRIEPDK
jgi:hypothetical protein